MFIEDEELFFVDYEDNIDKTILYAPLKSYLALITKDTMKGMISEDSSLAKNQVLDRIKARPKIDVKKILTSIQNSNPQLTIAITDNCNLRCVYCHASAGEKHKKKSMNKSMIDSIIKTFFENINKTSEKVKIEFTGGEPTYNYNNLRYAITKAKEYALPKNISCIFSMPTNGYYGKPVREFINSNFSSISLSFDGPAFIHNKHRPLANGKPSFDTVFETAKYFYDAEFSMAFRVTVSDFSINYLKEIIDFFSFNFPNTSIGLEHLTLHGRALKNMDIGSPSKKKFADALLSIYQYVEGKPIKIVNSAASEYDILRPVFCSAVGTPNWTVTVDGDILSCARDNAPEQFYFGRFDFLTGNVSIDENKVKIIREMNVFNYVECEDCFAKYHCAGDCADRRLSKETNCDSIRKIGKYILNKKINEN